MLRSLSITFSLLAIAAIAVAAPARTLDLSVSPSGERVLYSPRVEYPYEARRRHLEGRGYYIMHLRSDGTVARVEVVRSTGHVILDRAVIRGLSQWRFSPGAYDKVGTPVKFSMKSPTKTQPIAGANR